LEAYLQEPPPEHILSVEQPMMVPLYTSDGQFLEKPLIAVIDLLTHGLDGLKVHEFKTSSRRMSQMEVESALQASCYAHAVQQRYDEPVSVRFSVLVKTKKPAVQHLDTARVEGDLSRIGDIVQGIERAIEAEAFYPVANPLNCSGCAFFGACRQWKGCSASRRRHTGLA